MSGRERRGSSSDSTFLAALIAAAAAAELWLAWHYFGFLTGDDVEVLAEAFRRAVGFKYRAWDIRCLFVPDFIVAPFVWIGSALGIRDVRTLVVIATLPSIIATAISTALVHALALRWTADLRVARAAALLFAVHWLPFGFASTAYPRAISTACVLLAVHLLVNTTSPVAAAAAGALCGLAFADRFSEIVFLIPLLIVARRRTLVVVAAFVFAVALFVGFYDVVTWGEWFGSIRKFGALTLVEADFASRLKHQSVVWYLLMLPRWFSPALLPFAWLARRSRPAATIALPFVVVPVALLSLVAHKEMRYLQGVIPFAMLIAAIGFGAMRRRDVAIALLAIGLAWDTYGLRFVTRKSMPAVEAAQILGADTHVQTVVMSQLWAYGDRLYFGDRMNVIDVGTPPRNLSGSIRSADAVCLYDRDVTPEIQRTLHDSGFAASPVVRYSSAREVVVFRRVSSSSSGTSDPARR